MSKRALARYKDKEREDKKRKAETTNRGAAGNGRLNISEKEFVQWYESQQDQCHYCKTTFAEIKRLRLRRSFGYYVSWDIDRLDSACGYEAGNLALSCFMCNMAKASYFTEAEGMIIGRAVRQIVEARLSSLIKNAG
jgi:hypothetical protein